MAGDREERSKFGGLKYEVVFDDLCRDNKKARHANSKLARRAFSMDISIVMTIDF